MTGTVARVLVRGRVPVVAGWVSAAVAAVIFLPTISEAQSGALGQLVPKNAKAIQAELRSHELFKFPLLSRTLVVQRDAGGLSAAAQARTVRRAVALNRHELPGLRGIGGALALTNALGRPPFSRERSTTALTYLFFGADTGTGTRNRLAERLVARRLGRPEGYVGLTGAVPARGAQVDAITGGLPWVELATVVIVALAVGLHFRALGAPLLTLVTVALAYLIGSRLLAGAGELLGASVPQEVEPVIVVLLFGIITDYAIFLLSRFRARLGACDDPRAAAERTTRELMPIIFTAGITVAAASAALAVAHLSFFRAFGPGTALTVLVGLVVALTFLPAALALFGPGLFWPHRPGRDAPLAEAAEETPDEVKGRALRTRVVRLATKRPVAVAVAAAVVLLVLAAGLTQLRVGNPLIRGLPPGSEPRVAYEQASRGFAPGILSPTVLVVEGRGIVRRRRALDHLQRLLAGQPGVARVLGPRQNPLSRPFGGALSRTHNAARYFLVGRADPLGATAIARLRRLQRRLPVLLGEVGLPGARASLAGDTALVAETVDGARGDLGRVAPVALLAVVTVLALFLRALVAPLYLVAASLLAVAAALGASAWLFDVILGQDGVTYYVPFAAAVLLLSLGSDYNVFLVGRIWQEARVRPLREAVAVAGARAARPIAVAGVVLALSFAALALVPLRAFHELAFTTAAGLLLDAFLVRPVLVPALIALVGDRSGWPGHRLVSSP